MRSHRQEDMDHPATYPDEHHGPREGGGGDDDSGEVGVARLGGQGQLSATGRLGRPWRMAVRRAGT